MNEAIKKGKFFPTRYFLPENNDSLTQSTTKRSKDKLEISNFWKFTCPLCYLELENCESYEKHCKTHSFERPYLCPFCGEFRTDNTTSFKRHVATHTGDRPYRCELCSYSSIQKNDLRRHHRRKHSAAPSLT